MPKVLKGALWELEFKDTVEEVSKAILYWQLFKCKSMKLRWQIQLFLMQCALELRSARISLLQC